MQVFKLVNTGDADRLIIFDALPDRLLKGLRTRELAGLPRSWARFFLEIGSTRQVFKTETSVDLARNYTYKYTPIGKEPCFFVLEYTDINSDKEAWKNIGEYVRMNVGPEVRLREKLEDMALAMAQKPTDGLEIEPEDIPVIPVPSEVIKKESPDELVKAGEPVIVTEETVVPKKRGRPKKVVAVG